MALATALVKTVSAGREYATAELTGLVGDTMNAAQTLTLTWTNTLGVDTNEVFTAAGGETPRQAIKALAALIEELGTDDARARAGVQSEEAATIAIRSTTNGGTGQITISSLALSV